MPELTAAVTTIVAQFNLRSLIDIFMIAFPLYWLLLLLRGTTAIMLLRAIVALYLVGFLVSTLFQLAMVSWLLRNSLPAMLVAIPILFQPELRRVLEQVGRGFGSWRFGAPTQATLDTVEAVAQAGRILSLRRIGALVVLERETGLQDYVDQGVALDALLSPELLLSLFHNSSPFHDGAVVVRRGRVVAARCVMPLSDNTRGPLSMGMRHRAAMGISERTDALAVAISEERGTISVASNGQMLALVDGDGLKELLLSHYSPESRPPTSGMAAAQKVSNG